ncbi:MAG: 50S ribosomal protein L9 [Culicoidibacterales bacterium]
MKVIFLEDVKGKGKRGEIKEVPNGYGQFLIKNKQAEEANNKNINKLNREEDQKAEAYQNEIIAARELAKLLDKKEVKIAVKVGEHNRVFGSVSTKQIVEAYQKQHDIKLDKHNIHLEHPISAIGKTDVDVKLHKEVHGVLHVVVEGEK